MLQEIKNLDLIQVFQKFTSIITKGNKIWCCCILHKEKTPSCIITTNNFYCFGCGEHGNIITLYMKYYNLEYRQAIQKIASEFNIKYVQEFADNSITNCLKDALIHYRSNIHLIEDYCKSRRLNTELIEKFQLGYANNNLVINHLIHLRHSAITINKSGIISHNTLDALRNRLIFPLINKHNNLIGFAGRSVNNDIMPKYINCKETELFVKSEYLYGENLLTNNIEYAILVEGYMDVISLYGIGMQNIVATMGTNITDYHIKTLFSYVNNIYVMMDNDMAGINSIKRSIPILCKYLTHQKKIYICNIGKYKDADEMTEHTQDIQSILLQSQNIIPWSIDNIILNQPKYNIKLNNNSLDLNIVLRKHINSLCNYIIDSDTKTTYMQYYTQYYVSNYNNKKYNKQYIPPIPDTETQLISILLQNPDIIMENVDRLIDIQFDNNRYEEIRIILCIGLLYKKNIHDIILKIYTEFSDIVENLINNREFQNIISYRNFMIKFVSSLLDIMQNKTNNNV